MSGTANASVYCKYWCALLLIKERPHPVNVQTIISEIVLPSFERMDDILCNQAF